MKRILIFLFLLPNIGFSQSITDGLVGYWPFNGNANDESVNDNHGIVNGAILSVDRFNTQGSAYYFDGNSGITFPDNNLPIGNEPRTINFWIYPTDISQSQAILNYGVVSRGQRLSILLGTDGNGFISVGLNYHRIGTSNSEIDLNTWQMVTFVILGNPTTNVSNFQIYIDSQEVNIKTQAGSEKTLNTQLSNVLMMGNSGDATAFFDGSVDDVSIYNRALSSTEINSLFSSSNSSSAICGNLFCDGENIGIGTQSTSGYKLAVAGNILTEEVKVALQANWPDYVFEKDYDLKDLKNLEQYLQTNKHLPNIPNAKTIENYGYELSDMDSKLLEKIEELTLYIIEQNKKIIALEKRVQIIENQ